MEEVILEFLVWLIINLHDLMISLHNCIQHFWTWLSFILKAMFGYLHTCKVDIYRLIMGLSPWFLKPLLLIKYESISIFVCLMSISFKIFTKVLMNLLNGVVGEVISPIQTIFIKGGFIMEGVMIFHKTLNSIHAKKIEWHNL